MATLEPNIEKRLLEGFASSKLMALYGAVITDIGSGHLEITVAPKDFLLRSAGNFHGGVIASLADSAGGYAAGTVQKEGNSLLTVEFKINYLSQARGEKLITRARVLRSGQTLTIVQTDSFSVEQGTEQLVATALLTFIKEKNNSSRPAGDNPLVP